MNNVMANFAKQLQHSPKRVTAPHANSETRGVSHAQKAKPGAKMLECLATTHTIYSILLEFYSN
jgi:hypothetical protein